MDILDHSHALVVEHQPTPVEPRGGDCVVLAVKDVAHDHDARIARRAGSVSAGRR